MVIIQPSGGLCNRMRVINSGLEFARRKQTKLLVLWYCCDELNAPFEALFQPTDAFEVVNIHSLKDPRKIFHQLRARTRISNEDIEKHTTDGTLDQDYFDSIRLPAYIFTWEHFYPADEYFRLFQPAEPLQKRIDEVTAKFTSDMVSVHIRRTDQVTSIAYSKTENFIELMKKEIDANPNVTFFLATDDKDEEALLRRTFPGRIVSNENRTLRRDSLDGMYDALLDLYCLSACSKIIGSYFSSFTDTAAALSGIPKLIAGIDH
ncbi:MAG: hypothetical protein ACI4DV_01735 [Lachnospiraceae bacterium]